MTKCRRKGKNQRKRKNNQKFGATDEAREMSAEALARHQDARDLYSNYVNDDSTVWPIEDCTALMEAALAITRMTNAEVSIYNKARRYYSAQAGLDASHS